MADRRTYLRMLIEESVDMFCRYVVQALYWCILRRTRRWSKNCSRLVIFAVMIFALIYLVLVGNLDMSSKNLSTDHIPAHDSLEYVATHLDVKYGVVANHGELFTSCITLQNIGIEVITGSGWALYFHHPFIVIYLRSYGACIAKTDISPNWYVALDSGEAKVLRSTEGESLAFVEPFDSHRKWSKSREDKYHPFTAEERYIHNNITNMGYAPLPIIPQPIFTKFNKYGRKVKISDSWTVLLEPGCPEETNLLAAGLRLNVKSTMTQFGGQVVVPRLKDVEDFRSTGFRWHPREEQLKESYAIRILGGQGFSQDEKVFLEAPTCAGLYYATQSLLALGGRTLPVITVADAPKFSYRGFMLDVARNFVPKDEVMRLIKVMGMYKLNKLHLHLSDDEAWRLEIPGLPELIKVGARRGHTLNDSGHLLPQLGSGPFPDDTMPSSGLFYTQNDYRDILRHAVRHHIDVIPEIDMPGHARAAIKAMLANEKQREKSQGKTNDHTEKEDTREIVSDENTDSYLLNDPNDRSVYESVQGFNDNVVNPCIGSGYNFVRRVVEALSAMYNGITSLKTLHIGGDEVPAGALMNSPECMAAIPKGMGVKHIIRSFMKDYMATAGNLNLGVQAWDDKFFEEDGSPRPLFDVMRGTGYTSLAVHTRHSRWDGGRAHRPVMLANAGYKQLPGSLIDSQEYAIAPVEENPFRSLCSPWKSVVSERDLDPHTLLANFNTYKVHTLSVAQVIHAAATYLFLDHAQEPDPTDRGRHWAIRYIDTRRVFGFTPLNLYTDVDVDRHGNVMSKKDVCKDDMSGCPPLRKPENIIGMSAYLWTELVRTVPQLHQMLFPRLLAVAERSWYGGAAWESQENNTRGRQQQREADWTRFANSLGYRELKKLEKMGIHFYLPLPGAIVKKDIVYLNCHIPGLTIEYSTDNGSTWRTGTQVRLGKKKSTLLMRTSSYDGSRHSRTVSLLPRT